MMFGVFDFETTGLPLHRDADLRQQPRIIEFGGIITDGNDILQTEEFICNPEITIEPIITEITGLTNDDLCWREPFRNHLDTVRYYFGQCDVVITHNLSFDKSMLVYDLRRIGLSLKDIGWVDKIEVCTVEQTFQMYGRRMHLKELYALLVEPYVQKHRALDDVKLLHAVCQRIGLYEAFSHAP